MDFMICCALGLRNTACKFDSFVHVRTRVANSCTNSECRSRKSLACCLASFRKSWIYFLVNHGSCNSSSVKKFEVMILTWSENLTWCLDCLWKSWISCLENHKSCNSSSVKKFEVMILTWSENLTWCLDCLWKSWISCLENHDSCNSSSVKSEFMILTWSENLTWCCGYQNKHSGTSVVMSSHWLLASWTTLVGKQSLSCRSEHSSLLCMLS
jgi:hypothetical protein